MIRCQYSLFQRYTRTLRFRPNNVSQCRPLCRRVSTSINDPLLESTDQSGPISLRDRWVDKTQSIPLPKHQEFKMTESLYHPGVVRSVAGFKVSKSNHSSPSSQLQQAIQMAQQKMKKAAKVNNKKARFTEPAVFYGINFPTLARAVAHDEKKLQALAAALVVLCPGQKRKWLQFDAFLYELFSDDSLPLDRGTALMCTYALVNAVRLHRMGRNVSLKSPMVLLQRLESKHEHHCDASAGNISDEIAAETDSSEAIDVPSDTAVSGGVEGGVGSAIGNSSDRKNRSLRKEDLELELLGFELTLVAFMADQPAAQALRKKARIRLGAQGSLLLNSASGPIPLSTLKLIWENAPAAELINGYMFYQNLYEQVLLTVTAEPLVMSSNEEAIPSLLHAMMKSRFKSSQLVQTLFMHVLERGFTMRNGMRLFSTLVELDAVSFASYVLTKVMNSKVDGRAGLEFNVEISNKAAELVYQRLTEQRAGLTPANAFGDDAFNLSGTSALVLALYCFNNYNASSKQYKLLESIEMDVLQSCQKQSDATGGPIPLHKAILLLHTYAKVGRNYRPLIAVIDQVIDKHAHRINPTRLSTIIWATARLNNAGAPYLSQAVDRYMKAMTESSGGVTIRGPRVVSMMLSLWAMAALERLDEEMIRKVLPIMQPLLEDDREGWEMSRSLSVQLMQIRAEIYLKKIKYESQSAQENGTKQQQQEQQQLEENVYAQLLRKSRNVVVREPNQPSSSFMHRDASAVLHELGVDHENEKVLEDVYVVDIFIPPRSEGDGKGTVIEMDGPSHFETYLKLPLGPTCMKHRHLREMGYRLASIPYWQYATTLSPHSKENILRDALRDAN